MTIQLIIVNFSRYIYTHTYIHISRPFPYSLMGIGGMKFMTMKNMVHITHASFSLKTSYRKSSSWRHTYASVQSSLICFTQQYIVFMLLCVSIIQLFCRTCNFNTFLKNSLPNISSSFFPRLIRGAAAESINYLVQPSEYFLVCTHAFTCTVSCKLKPPYKALV